MVTRIGLAMLFYMICCEAFVTNAACAISDRSFLLELFRNVVSSAFVFISVIPFEVMPAKS